MRTTPTHVYFWGGVFSNFFECSITFQENKFPSSEHAFMWAKATHFGDTKTAKLILKAPSPKEAKKLGRAVTPFDPVQWDLVSFDLMVEILVCKFSQNPAVKKLLLRNNGKIFVEGFAF